MAKCSGCEGFGSRRGSPPDDIADLAETRGRWVGVLLGGVAVEDRLVRELAAILDRSLGAKLEKALLFRATVMGLTREERSAVLAALEKAPAELQVVRDMLLSDDSWRLHKRL